MKVMSIVCVFYSISVLGKIKQRSIEVNPNFSGEVLLFEPVEEIADQTYTLCFRVLLKHFMGTFVGEGSASKHFG